MSQKRMGPAPFASFEDLSDEVRPGGESPVVTRLPDIRECISQSRSPTPAAGSVGSSLQTPNTPRIDISRASSSSHHEEDSRDSTPERELFEPTCSRLGLAFKEDGALDLRSSTEELDFQEPELQTGKKSPAPSENTPAQQIRKDSQGSELGFLSVSGRTSRLSSIGSQGSRVSNASHLSGMSRSPSPHKMLLETSFCGTKLALAAGSQQTSGASVVLEQVLLARKHDPTEAVLAEGISIEMRKKIQTSPKKIQRITPVVVEPPGMNTIPPPIAPGSTIIAESGVEYTFIPLKGPLPKKGNKKEPLKKQLKLAPKPAGKSSSLGPEYIRIKLKPDHMYTEEDQQPASNNNNNSVTTTEFVTEQIIAKPVSLNLNNGTGRCTTHHQRTVSGGGSPKLPRLKETTMNSRTPSPASVSRKSSFTSLFRSKEAIMSPESPSDRVRSKSKERDQKSSVFGIFKPKKTCTKLQKKETTENVITSPLPSLEFKFNQAPVKKYYETPLEGDSIRIPLHSPSETTDTPKIPSAEELPPVVNPRHSSTSSENIIFSTNLGSNNEIFTTKLPKERTKYEEKTTDIFGEIPNEQVEGEHVAKSEIQVVDKIVHMETARQIKEINSEQCENIQNHVALETPVELLRKQEEQNLSSDNESENESERTDILIGPNNKSSEVDEHELKTLVFQQDSFEDEELPYVPTTLPLERSVAVPIVPVKQRAEVKMCPIERPRSTTPINPSCLEEYCEDVFTMEPKLRISLPKEESAGKSKSPRKWTDFAEKDMGKSSSPPPPPLPPRGAPKDWINFEEVPERRKPAKRIQVIPSSRAVEENVIYSYVNPEDCKCECHELAPRGAAPPDDLPLVTSSSHSKDAFPHNISS